MSDFFISQVLILSFLLVTVIRPFGKTILYIHGIALFPLIAVILTIISICAFDLIIEMIPVLLCCTIIFFASLRRLGNFVLGLPTDNYTVSSQVWCIVGIVLTVLCGYASFMMQPHVLQELPLPVSIEKTYCKLYKKSDSSFVVKNGYDTFFQKTTAECTIWNPVPTTEMPQNQFPCVLYVPGAQANRKSRDILARVLAGNGYTVIAADFPGTSYANTQNTVTRLLNNRMIRETALMFDSPKDAAEIYISNRWLQNQLNKTYRVAEALAVAGIIPQYMIKEPFVICEQFSVNTAPVLSCPVSGMIILCGEGVPSVVPEAALIQAGSQHVLSSDVINYSTVMLYSDCDQFAPFGEIRYNHPLFSQLKKLSPTEYSAQQEQTTAQTVRKYFDIRRNRPVPLSSIQP